MENDQLINKPSFRLLPFSLLRLRHGRPVEMRMGWWWGADPRSHSTWQAPRGSQETQSALRCTRLYLPLGPPPSVGHGIRLKSPALLRLASALPWARRPPGEPSAVSAQRRGCLPAEGSGFGREPSAWLSDLEVIYTPPPSCSGIQTRGGGITKRNKTKCKVLSEWAAKAVPALAGNSLIAVPPVPDFGTACLVPYPPQNPFHSRSAW